MRTPAHRLVSLLVTTALAAVASSIAFSQDTTPPSPAREAPRPQDLDPAVDTSSPGNAQAGAPAAQGAPARPAAKSRGQDRLELDTTQITGNRELPKVLYIVPWKRSDLGDLVGKPVNSLLDEVLTPVDRDVFKRENRYFRALTPGADEGAGGAGNVKPAPRRATPTNPASPPAGSVGSASKPATGSGSAAPPTRDER